MGLPITKGLKCCYTEAMDFWILTIEDRRESLRRNNFKQAVKAPTEAERFMLRDVMGSLADACKRPEETSTPALKRKRVNSLQASTKRSRKKKEPSSSEEESVDVESWESGSSRGRTRVRVITDSESERGKKKKSGGKSSGSSKALSVLSTDSESDESNESKMRGSRSSSYDSSRSGTSSSAESPREASGDRLQRTANKSSESEEDEDDHRNGAPTEEVVRDSSLQDEMDYETRVPEGVCDSRYEKNVEDGDESSVGTPPMLTVEVTESVRSNQWKSRTPPPKNQTEETGGGPNEEVERAAEHPEDIYHDSQFQEEKGGTDYDKAVENDDESSIGSPPTLTAEVKDPVCSVQRGHQSQLPDNQTEGSGTISDISEGHYA